MLDDDDFKISMDDIKDMVSELFGEKVDKVEAEAAKKILKQEMLEFFESGLDSVSDTRLNADEEKLLKEYESNQAEETAAPAPVIPPVPEQKPNPGGLPEIDEAAFHKNLEERKTEDGMREKIKKELEEEQARKKEATLKKIEESKRQSAAYQAELTRPAANPGASGALSLNYTEIINILNMFDQTQKVFATILSKLIKRKPVETMFLRTLEKTMEKHTEVLKKADLNQGGKVRDDGSIETMRVAANLNGMHLPEEKRAKRFLLALHDVFEERLIATELATSLETKDDVTSAIIMQTEKIFEVKAYTTKLQDIFMEHVIPNTTMKAGD